MARRAVAVLIFLLWLVGLAEAQPQEKRFALLIGNQAYGAEIGSLANPHNDVALLERTLTTLSFDVTVVRDASLGTLHQAVNAFARKVKAGGTNTLSFFYYSGHGAADGGTNYLIPVDVRTSETGELWDQSLRLTEITRKLKSEAPEATHFVVFDACRNTLKLRQTGTRALLQSKGFLPVSQESGMLIAYATAEGELASDIGTGAGPYARVLAEEIVRPGIEAVTMFRRVQVRVRSTIGQEPWLGFSALAEVHFGGAGGSPQQAPTQTAQDAAAQAWAFVKDTADIATLDAFRKVYGAVNPVFDRLAAERIAELRRAKAAVPAPTPSAPSPAPSPQQKQAAATPQPQPATSAARRTRSGSLGIGVLTDMTGPFSKTAGQGSVWAARKAVDDFCERAMCFEQIRIIVTDHTNRPDIGAEAAKKMIADKIDVIVDVPTSSVALAVSAVVKDANGVMLASGPAASDLTGRLCSPNTIHWTYDTWALANGLPRGIVKTGGTSWFFLTADYAFGADLERDAEAAVKGAGGRVVGKVRHNLMNSDYAAYLLQAQSSKAAVIGLASAGADTINAIKQAAEFGITSSGQKLAALLATLTDVHGLGLKTAEGLLLMEAWYWDMSDANRAFARAFAAANDGAMPTMVHAGVYASVLHYLKAVHELGSAGDGKAVVARMKSMPTEDPLFGRGAIRADGRKIHDMLVFEVKSPSQSKGPWDYYKLRATIPAAEAFRPLKDGGCPLVK